MSVVIGELANQPTDLLTKQKPIEQLNNEQITQPTELVSKQPDNSLINKPIN
jgi:hypothetical protein